MNNHQNPNNIIHFQSSDNRSDRLETKSISSNPASSLLHNWQFLIAIELIKQWQNGREIDLDLETILKDLKLSKDKNYENLLSSLKSKIKSKTETTKTVDLLLKTYDNLQEFFLEVVAKQLRQVNRNLRNENIDVLQQLVADKYLNASTQKTMAFFNSLSEALSVEKNNYERLIDQCLEKESSARHAYFQLKRKLKNTVNNSLEFRSIREGMSNALFLCFESRLQAGNYRAKSQLISTQIQICQSYYDAASSSNKMFDRIKAYCEQKLSIDLISIPVFSYLRRIDADEQKNLLEVWAGHSLNYFGKAPVSWQQIQRKLLNNIEPIVLEIYQDFHHRYIEHTK